VFRLRPAGITLAILFFIPCAQAQEAEEPWKNFVAEGQHAAGDKDYAKAEQAYLKAVHEAERFAADDWRVGVTLESLGQVYTTEKKFSDADTALRRALGIIGKANGDDSVEAANVNFDIARLMLDSGHQAESIQKARKALSTFESSLGGTSVQTAAVLCLMGDALRTMKNFVDAEAPLKRCADIQETDGGIDSTELADALHGLALTYMGEGKYTLADARFKLAEKIRESKLGLTSPLLAQTMEDHAGLLRMMGRDKDAERLLVLATAIRRTEKRNNH
jgi:tetratricopeptide (TPR) repeat protein